MANNVTIQTYRGTYANLSSLASTGKIGVLAWTTDSNELFMDNGSGTAGIGAPGSGKAWTKVSAGNALFSASSSVAMTGLAAQVGDLVNRTDLNQLFILTVYPATSAGNWTAISPNSSITGIVGLAGPTTNQWVTYVDTTGTQHLVQPAFSNLSGALTQAQLPASIGSGSNLTSIDCGTF